MYSMTEAEFATHRRDVEAGNIISYDPGFDGGPDFHHSPYMKLEAKESDNLQQELDVYLAKQADGIELSEYELECAALLEAEIAVAKCEESMAEIAEEHPKYVWHVGQLLVDWLNAKKREGLPVDDEMYIEAHALAKEIVQANPDKNADELTEVVNAMVELINAEQQLREVEELIAVA